MKLLTRILSAALLIALAAGCTDDRTKIDLPAAANGTEAVFTVSVPGMRTPSTRALTDGQEKEVTAVDVVIFDNVDNKMIEHHVIDPADITILQQGGGNDYRFRVRGIQRTSNITIAVIANAPVEVAHALIDIEGKLDFLPHLRLPYIEGMTYADKWNADANDNNYRAIPMYGEVRIVGNILNAAVQTVSLTRMLAKVDVVNSVATSDFKLTNVHVVNYNTRGLVAPQWNQTTGAPASLPASTPNIPSWFDPATVAWAAAGDQLTYDVDATDQSLLGEIYLFESDALSGNPATPDGVRLVLEGDYTSGGVTRHYFYPADFTYPRDDAGGTTAYMPVLRNHRYLFTISEASGRGYDTMGEAAAAFGVMSNLRTSLVVVDEGDIKEMVFNGEYFLGVEAREIFVTHEAQEVSIKIATDNPQGWKAVVEDAAANQWLTLVTTAGQIADKTLTFDVSTYTGEWEVRSGTIRLTAGRLDMHVAITQGEYRIIAEPAYGYMLNGQTHTFYVRSNVEWRVKSVTGDVGILTDVEAVKSQSGNINTTTGNPFNFEVILSNELSYLGKIVTVVLEDPTGKAPDKAIELKALVCGSGGTAVALPIGKNGYPANPGAEGTKTYLTHIYNGKCWMVQNSREGIGSSKAYGLNWAGASIGTMDTPANSGKENGYYYTWAQANQGSPSQACPNGWQIPTESELRDLFDLYRETSSALKPGADGDESALRWWGGSRGSVNGAYAGGAANISGQDTWWVWWGERGAWWCARANYYYEGYRSGLYGSKLWTAAWASVRCVQD